MFISSHRSLNKNQPTPPSHVSYDPAMSVRIADRHPSRFRSRILRRSLLENADRHGRVFERNDVLARLYHLNNEANPRGGWCIGQSGRFLDRNHVHCGVWSLGHNSCHHDSRLLPRTKAGVVNTTSFCMVRRHVDADESRQSY